MAAMGFFVQLVCLGSQEIFLRIIRVYWFPHIAYELVQQLMIIKMMGFVLSRIQSNLCLRLLEDGWLLDFKGFVSLFFGKSKKLQSILFPVGFLLFFYFAQPTFLIRLINVSLFFMHFRSLILLLIFDD
jgi:hypothetical protein